MNKTDKILIALIVVGFGYFVARGALTNNKPGLEPDPGVEFGQNEPLYMHNYADALDTGSLKAD